MAAGAVCPRGAGLALAERVGVIEIDLPDGVRVRVDDSINEKALRRVLSALLCGCAAAMLAGFWFADPQLRMLAAAPMDRQDDLARRLVDIGDDVGNEGPQEPLASTHADDWRVPGGFEIVGESSEIRHDSGRVRYSHRIQPRLACRRSSQRRFPALLELRGDQPVVGIAGSVAPLGERGLVAGLLQFQLSDALSFALVLHMSPLGLQGRLNRHRLYSTKDLLGDRRIDARAAEG